MCNFCLCLSFTKILNLAQCAMWLAGESHLQESHQNIFKKQLLKLLLKNLQEKIQKIHKNNQQHVVCWREKQIFNERCMPGKKESYKEMGMCFSNGSLFTANKGALDT